MTLGAPSPPGAAIVVFGGRLKLQSKGYSIYLDHTENRSTQRLNRAMVTIAIGGYRMIEGCLPQRLATLDLLGSRPHAARRSRGKA